MKEHKKILSYGIELLIIIVSIAFATYAWFNKNQKIASDDLYINTDSYLDLLVSLDGENYTTETSLNLPNDFQFKNEITGNGINFYTAASKKDDGTPITFKQAVIKKDYLEFDIWFKLSGKGGIFLQNNSYIIPSVGTNSSNLIGPNVERISTSGDFSRDLIASSVRMAFVENDYIDNKYILESNPSLVWAPNKNYEISCNKICTANLNSTNKQDYRYVDAGESSYYYLKSVTNLKDELKTTKENDMAYGDPMITYIDSSDGIKKVTVRVWIEGNDRDNVTALTGGMFIMNLQFTALNKQLDNTEPDVYIDGFKILNFDETMEYSVDNKLTWISYEENNDPTFSTNQEVYVRKSETVRNFASISKGLKF